MNRACSDPMRFAVSAQTSGTVADDLVGHVDFASEGTGRILGDSRTTRAKH